jgi:NifU-like protein involved in Fe-S cluster formation
MGEESDNSNRDTEATPGPVLFYNEVVIDHFTNPRNVGELSEAETDSFGLVGDPSCADQMKLWIGVRGNRIAKIAFKSFGCPGAIATSSMLTALAEGKTIVEGLQGICVSTGSACSTGDPEPSHVLLAMGLSARDAQGSIRISLGRSTEEADVEATAKALQATVERLRAISSVGEGTR